MRHTPDTDDVQRMIERAIRADRLRLSASLRARAKECGNGVAAALDAVAESVEGES